jgi:hypothetical protein
MSEKVIEVPRVCRMCDSGKNITRHHLKDWINGKYRRTGEKIILCRDCHDIVEQNDDNLLEIFLNRRVKGIMDAKKNRNHRLLKTRCDKLKNKLDEIKACANIDTDDEIIV